MLGKLIKYEWKGYRLPLIIMLIVLAGTTALTCGVILTINPKYDNVLTGYSFMAAILSIFLYYFGLIGCTVGTMLVIAVRFYKTCYTDQGYLTHTLPVTPLQLLNAKIIAAILTYLLVLAAIVGTIFILMNVIINHILVVTDLDYVWARDIIKEGFSSFLHEFDTFFGIRFGPFLTSATIYIVISIIASIISVFGCISLGQLYAKHRVLGAIAAYFILQFIEAMIGYIITIPMYANIFETGIKNQNLTFYYLYAPSLWESLTILVIAAIVLYFANLHMMTKKLNLE